MSGCSRFLHFLEDVISLLRYAVSCWSAAMLCFWSSGTGSFIGPPKWLAWRSLVKLFFCCMFLQLTQWLLQVPQCSLRNRAQCDWRGHRRCLFWSFVLDWMPLTWQQRDLASRWRQVLLRWWTACQQKGHVTVYSLIYRHCSLPYQANGEVKEMNKQRRSDFLRLETECFGRSDSLVRPTSFWSVAQKWYKLHLASVKHNKRSAWWRTYSFICRGASSAELTSLSDGSHQLPFWDRCVEAVAMMALRVCCSQSKWSDLQTLIPSKCGSPQEIRREDFFFFF